MTDHKPISLLCVDDEPLILKSIRRVLMDIDIEIRCAANGKEALELLEQAPADIILSDMQMPVMNGAEFLPKASELCPSAILLVLSAQSSQEQLEQSLCNACIWGYIKKPWDNDELESIILSIMEDIKNEDFSF